MFVCFYASQCNQLIDKSQYSTLALTLL